MVIALVVCITLAPMFSSEYQTGADAILLSTKFGRSKLIVAKIVSSFLSYSRSSRTYNNILNLMPAKMAAAYTALTKYEVFHLFGLNISYPIMLILVALLVSVITLPFAYRAFHKHQVA